MPTSIIAMAVGAAVSGAVATSIGAGFASALAGGLASMAFNAAFASPPDQLNQQPLTQELRDNLVTVRQPISNWQYIYGRTRVSGALTFAHESADQNFHLVITYAGHVCDEIQTIQFNDEVVPLDGSGNATGKYAGYVRIQKSLGAEAGQPFADLVTESEGKWTDAHRQSGRTKIYVRLTPNADLFPTGLPNITAIIKGKKVYDPRTATTVWSQNASLCQADYVCDVPAGLEAVYADEIDSAQLIAAANIDDESVSITGGGSEARYTLNGAFLVNTSPGDVLGKMLTANSGKVRYIGGMFLVQPAAYVSPTITITEDDCRAVPHIIPRLSAADLCNGVKGLYVSEDNLWQASDFPPVTNATYLAEDEGERAWLDLNLPFTKSVSTAQRIAKIELERRRQQITVEWPGKFNCYRLQAGNTGMLTFAMMGWSGKVFEVAQTSLVFEDDNAGGVRLGADLVLRETAAGVYDWNSGEETTVDLAPDTNLPDPFAVTPPTDLVLVDSPLILQDGTVIPRIIASWTPSGYAFTTGWEVRYRIGGETAWQTEIVTDPTITLQPLSVGDEYDIQIFTLTPLGRSQTALSVSGHVAVGQVTAPNAPANLTATSGLFQVGLAWTLDVGTRRDIRHTEIWASLTNDRATALRITCAPWPDVAYAHIGLSPGQQWYYWARLEDSSGNHSAYYPSGATSGISGSPSSDPSALLTQLRNALGLDQLIAELAAPIQVIEAGNLQNAIVGIQNALADYDLTARLQWQEAVTNATITLNPETGAIELLATAVVTTDVEARLTQAELDINAADATLSAQVATLTTVEGDLTAAQSAITLLQSSVAIGASEIYVENAVGNALGGINVTSANAYSNLAQAEIKSALEMFDTQQAVTSINGTVAAALETLQAHADAIASEVTVRTSLVSAIAANAAAIVSEQTTRANAVSAEAEARLALASRVTSAEGTITTHGSAISNMYTKSQVDGSISGLSTTLTTNYQNADAAVYTNAQSYVQTYAYSKSQVDSSEAGLSTTLTTNYQNADATVYSNAQSYVNTYAYSKAGADGVIASSVAVVSARLDSGDYAAVKTQSSASASAITGLQAKYGVKVDVSGHVTGFEILGSATSGDFVILADKFLIVKPDGTGTPKQVLMLGTVNGTTALGLDGSLIIDGSIVARSIDTRNLSVKDGSGNVILSSGQKLTGTWIADLAVDTLQIAGNAVTLPVSAYTSGMTYQTGGAGDIEVQALSISTSGRPVLIISSFYLDATAYGYIRYPTVRIKRDGTEIYSVIDEFYNLKTHTISFTDTPSAGAHTYSVSVSTALYYDSYISKRSLVAIEVKK